MEIWTLGLFSIYYNDNLVSCSFSVSVLTLNFKIIRQAPYDFKATNIIYLWLDPRNLIQLKLLLFPGRFCQARIQDRVWESSQGTGLSSLHRVSGGHEQSWLRMNPLKGVSSSSTCPSFKTKDPRWHLWSEKWAKTTWTRIIGWHQDPWISVLETMGSWSSPSREDTSVCLCASQKLWLLTSFFPNKLIMPLSS